MYHYPLDLHTEPTGVWLSCPDIPEMNASGKTLDEALAEALNGLESACACTSSSTARSLLLRRRMIRC